MDRRVRITLLFSLLCLALTAPAALADYSTTVLADSPLSYWRLDETTGLVANDASSNDVDGAIASGAEINVDSAFGALGRAVRLDSSESISATAVSQAPKTVELWVRAESRTPAREHVFVTVGDPGSTGFSIGVTKKRKLFYRGSGGTINARNVSVAWNRWTQVDVSITASQVIFRVNGGGSNRTLGLPGGVVPTAAGPITVGDQPGGGQHDLQGTVDEVALYKDVLSIDQVKNHFRQTGAPLALSAPTISGTPVVGGTLSAGTGTWQNPTTGVLSYAYQWQHCNDTSLGGTCVDIDGATADTLSVSQDLVGDTVQVEVTATNVNGTATSFSDEVGPVDPEPTPNSAPHNDALPVIIGIQPYVGRALSSTPGTWSGFPAPTLTQQWERCDAGGGSCVEVPGQTDVGYMPSSDDIGSTLRLVVTGTNTVGSASAHSAVTSVITDPTVAPDPGPVDGSGNTNTGGSTNTGGNTNTGTVLPGTATSCLRFTALPKRLNKKVKGLGRLRIGPVKGSKAGVAAVKLQVRMAKGKKLKSVTWTLDGKKLKTAKKRPYTLSLLPAVAGKAGTHVLRAKLTPKKGKSRTLKTFVLVKAC